MQPLKGKLSITLDQDIIEKLKELSEYELRSVSQLINCILRDTLIILIKIIKIFSNTIYI